MSREASLVPWRLVQCSNEKPDPPAMDRTKKMSRWYFGGLASAGAACCTHPLDLLKVGVLRIRFAEYICRELEQYDRYAEERKRMDVGWLTERSG